MEALFKFFADKVKAAQDDRTLTFVISDETQDRDGEIIRQAGWDFSNYLKNPVVILFHDANSLPVGKVVRLEIEGDKTLADVKFATAEENPQADTAYKLAKGGYLNTVSVRFRPIEWKDGDGQNGPLREFTKQELLEVSLVVLPANPNAVRKSLEAVADKAVTPEQFGELLPLSRLAPGEAPAKGAGDDGEGKPPSNLAGSGEDVEGGGLETLLKGVLEELGAVKALVSALAGEKQERPSGADYLRSLIGDRVEDRCEDTQDCSRRGAALVAGLKELAATKDTNDKE